MLFSEFDLLSESMISNLEKAGYKEMTLVQRESLPHILKQKDVIVEARTGSGKSATFGIGIVENLDVRLFRVQSIVLCPTRELATQVSNEIRVIAKCKKNVKVLTLCGGESFKKQSNSLSHHAHIIVATPGRVLKHLRGGILQLSCLRSVVLDEADRMLDMGFKEEIEDILSFLPEQKQTMLFSATYTPDIIGLGKKLQNNAIEIRVTSCEKPNALREIFCKTDNKLDALLKILFTYKPQNVMVFVNTKLRAQKLASILQDRNIDALSIHGDLQQYERDDVFVEFLNGSCRVLVATDVAARGLDVKSLSMVVNYDLAYEKQNHIHRIGRTARAGESGYTFTLFCGGEADVVEEYKTPDSEFCNEDSLGYETDFTMYAKNKTVVIEGGKKSKLRISDILGAFVKDASIQHKDVGNINIYYKQTYVAVSKLELEKNYNKIKNIRIKGKKFPVWILE